MKRLFAHYGDVVSFDLSFNLIKNPHRSGKKWKVGFFLGTSNCKHVVPLGLVATLNETKETYAQIFKTFFNAMGDTPGVVVTDEERAISAALNELKSSRVWFGNHLYDSYHILHNVRKKLKKKDDIGYFSHLIHAKNEYEFDYWVRRAENKLE